MLEILEKIKNTHSSTLCVFQMGKCYNTPNCWNRTSDLLISLDIHLPLQSKALPIELSPVFPTLFYEKFSLYYFSKNAVS